MAWMFLFIGYASKFANLEDRSGIKMSNLSTGGWNDASHYDRLVVPFCQGSEAMGKKMKESKAKPQ